MGLSHIPLRRCVGCGVRLPQSGLNRIVKSLGGGVEVDTMFKLPGRGAYLCSHLGCWERSVRKGRVDYALRTKLSPDEREYLLGYAQKRLMTS